MANRTWRLDMKRGSRITIFMLLLMVSASAAQAAEKERWLRKTGFGLMFHYEAFKTHNPKRRTLIRLGLIYNLLLEAVEEVLLKIKQQRGVMTGKMTRRKR